MDLHQLLMDIANYPDETGPVQFRETHISRLYLTREHVYKIKKPVDFGFLNFTTLDRRRHFCEEELRLNRRFAGESSPYLNVLPLGIRGKNLTFDGSGETVEYAVLMRRLPADRMLDHLLENDSPELEALIDQLSPLLSRIHAKAPVVFQDDDLGPDAEIVTHNWRENFEQTAPFAGQIIPENGLAASRSAIERFIEEQKPLLQHRQEEGFVREVHGDLHSEHICFTEPVQIYDCIEFNRHFRTSDILCDLAFLLMDLKARKRRDLAQRLLDGYRSHGDCGPGADTLIPFYEAYRAWVRGKVAGFSMAQQPEGSAAREEQQILARSYLNLAMGSLAPQFLVLTCGLMGAGKSVVARRLCEATGALYLRSDEIRKELAGLAPQTKVAIAFGTGIYSSAASDHTYQIMLERAEEALRQGRSVVVDAAFAQTARREPFFRLGQQLEVPTRLVHLVCDDATLRARLLRREAKGTNISDGRLELLDEQRRAFEPVGGEALELDTHLERNEKVGLVLSDILEEAHL